MAERLKGIWVCVCAQAEVTWLDMTWDGSKNVKGVQA